MAVKNASRTTTRAGSSSDRPSRQRALIMAGLMGSLALVSVLLLTLAPPPLKRDKAISLLAVDPVEGIFRTDVPVAPGKWTAIYIHHSKTAGGDEQQLEADSDGPGDHFLIGNGDGTGDGDIVMCQRWLSQSPAIPGAAQLPAGTISICIIGDLDVSAPTAAQFRRLGDLVKSLQRRLDIPTQQILIHAAPASSTGIGRNFPRTEFARNLQL